MTDALHLTPREVAQVEAALDEPDNGTDCGRCRHCPTPIDPADIRPGDVVEARQVRTAWSVDERHVWVSESTGLIRDWFTWHLVHRPDPDAEAVEALAKNVLDISNPDAYDRENVALALAALREQGWDVVRRAES